MGSRGGPCEGDLSRRPWRGDRGWGQGEWGIPGASYRGAGGGLLARGGVPGQGGGGAVPRTTRDAPVVGRRELSPIETRTRGCGGDLEAVEVAGRGATVGE